MADDARDILTKTRAYMATGDPYHVAASDPLAFFNYLRQYVQQYRMPIPQLLPPGTKLLPLREMELNERAQEAYERFQEEAQRLAREKFEWQKSRQPYVLPGGIGGGWPSTASVVPGGESEGPPGKPLPDVIREQMSVIKSEDPGLSDEEALSHVRRALERNGYRPEDIDYAIEVMRQEDAERQRQAEREEARRRATELLEKIQSLEYVPQYLPTP